MSNLYFINSGQATTSAVPEIKQESQTSVHNVGIVQEEATEEIPGVEGYQDEARATIIKFWRTVSEDIRAVQTVDLKQQALPLARIKKIMKLDEDVRMISAEAPMLFAKAAEIFVQELTLRSWLHTEDNKRRTLQRNDIAMAITKFDQFDFLIDIVPREDIRPPAKPVKEEPKSTSPNEQVQWYVQLANPAGTAMSQGTTGQPVVAQTTSGQQTSIIVPTSQQLQTPTVTNAGQQLIMHNTSQTAGNQNIQLMQQVIGPNGEVQQIPIQLSQQQLQMIRVPNSGQQLIIQASPQQQIVQIGGPGSSGQVYLTQSTQHNGDSE